MNTRLIFNIGIGAAAVIVFFVLFLVSVFVGGAKKRVDKYFAILILFYSFTLSISFSLYLFRLYGNHNEIVLKILYSFIFFFLYSTSVITLAYCFNYFRPHQRRLRKVLLATILPVFSGLGIYGAIFIIYDKLFVFKNNVIALKPPFIPLYIPYALIFFISFFVCIIKTKKTLFEFFSFTLLTVGIPVALLFDYLFLDTAIFSLSLITFFLLHFLLYYIEKGKRISEQEKNLQEQQASLMVSQIQPHFIYNCLSSISYLCQVDGQKASEAIDDFSRYLRMNLSNINKYDLVPFEKELEYINVYVKLEKLRFGDRVKVHYNLKIKDFFLPSLSVQPLVENAIKHGITKKIKGGTVKINTLEEKGNIVIVISDNGVGFNETSSKDDRVHIGLTNTKNRIEKLCDGTVECVSKINKGTTVTIRMPKRKVTNLKEIE